MTRIEELQKEITLLKELLDLYKLVNQEKEKSNKLNTKFPEYPYVPTHPTIPYPQWPIYPTVTYDNKGYWDNCESADTSKIPNEQNDKKHTKYEYTIELLNCALNNIGKINNDTLTK